MKIFLCLLCLGAFVFIEKAIRFFLAGGTLTMPARNATFLYEQIKIVYPKMRENSVRYLALLMNSSAARSELPKQFIQNLVLEYAGREWEELCIAYTWIWAECVGHVDMNRIPADVHLSKSEKIRDQIEEASYFTAHGDRRYEKKLRSIPQFVLLSILADLEMNVKD